MTRRRIWKPGPKRNLHLSIKRKKDHSHGEEAEEGAKGRGREASTVTAGPEDHLLWQHYAIEKDMEKIETELEEDRQSLEKVREENQSSDHELAAKKKEQSAFLKKMTLCEKSMAKKKFDMDKKTGIRSLMEALGELKEQRATSMLHFKAESPSEVVSLMATAVEHLVTGETMQISTSREQRRSMEYYLQKTYYKTASLISNSCKAVAILAGHTADVSLLAYEYGRNLGLAFQLIDDVLDFTGTSASLGKGSLSDIRHGIITAPMLYAMEEFPQLHDVVDQGFDNPANVELALDYLQKSRGIERTKELAQEHVNLAVKAIEALPDSDDEDVLISRRALIDITQRVITRTK